ncbi:MAG: putative peptidoglycan glycosyltransferase FtsW [Planctomycetota bacterium]|nr:putative peptidoglycan glycosyltransferase FtsW [Planctomycetota bacterium]
MMQPSIYRMRVQDILVICVLALMCLGVVMVQSASMSVANAGQAMRWHWTDAGTRHLIFVAIALVTFFGVGFVDYGRLLQGGWLRNPILWFLVISGLACVAVLVPGIGQEVNGARRWFRVGPIQIQPSELGKWAVVLLLAWVLAERTIDVSKFSGFVAMLIPVGAICLLVVIEDFGTAALIGLCALAMCMAGRVKLWHLAVVVPPVIVAGMYFVMHKEYRWRRMTAFMDPYAAPEKEGYHMIQSLLSFSTGGVFGRGLGRGIQKLGYLPEDTTDFIFAVISEELGLFGAMLTIALYLGILYVVWQAIRQRQDAFGQLLAFGVGAMIAIQALINIAVATVSVPPKGMSLPLVSAGGSGLVITSGALGLLYSVCRGRKREEAGQVMNGE